MTRLFSRLRSLFQARWRRSRLDAGEARRRTHGAFRGLENYKERGRDTWGVRWIDALALDARLGLRMLVKHRGLTIVGGFAMAVAIGIGAVAFEVFTQMLESRLPFAHGERVVALQLATPTPGNAERRVLHDFVEWRDELQSIEQLGAFRTVRLNLVSGAPPFEIVPAAEITASGFAVAGTPPLAGRHLLPADERDGAPPVLVIGYQAWQTRFAADPHVVGRTINLGGTPFTIVGVMPEGFRFPLHHQYWIPLRTTPLPQRRPQGPAVFVFGRLAPGVTLDRAQAELTTIWQRTATADPETHQRLRPVVLQYTHDHVSLTTPFRRWMLRIALFLVGALVFVVAVNLAILVYARTVSRLGEIAVRTALGASRRRILAQLFTEAFVLALAGAGAGLALAQLALERLQAMLLSSGSALFWIDLRLSAGTAIYAFALAALAAAIMGVLPGIKATTRGVSANLRQLDGRTGARLGPIWTTLVVAQVAIAVAALPTAVYLTWQVVRMGIARPQIPAEEFVVGIVGLDDVAASEVDHFRARQLELTTRLQAEPGVAAVTFSSAVPGFAPGRMVRFETSQTRPVKYASVDLGIDSLEIDLDLFEVFGARILAGRALMKTDLGRANTVVVNRAFVHGFVDQGAAPDAALGIRFRYVSASERPRTSAETSYEIVGVVDDFPGFPPEPGSDGQPTIYHPAAPGDVHPVALSVRLAGGTAEGFVDRFRAIGADLDPALQIRRVAPLIGFYEEFRAFWRYLAWTVGALTVSVLLLSAAGIYAMMSFTVSQRTREIAIRAALGAAPFRLVLGIFGRAAGQLALGLVVGSVLSAAVFQNTDFTARQAATLTLAVAAIMIAVGLLAAVGPARRGLRIDASEVLKADA